MPAVTRASGEPVTAAPSTRWYGLAGVGLVLGAVAGWLAGLLRLPREAQQDRRARR